MIQEFKKNLDSLISELKAKLNEIRGHRLGLSFLENLEIEIYGRDYPLKSLGFLSQLDHLTFRFEAFDENSLGEIESGLRNKNLGLSLSREKKSLIIKFPPLTEETKKKILKTLAELKEEVRIKARKLRDEFLKELKNKKERGEISEDDFYKTREKIDEEIEKFNKSVEEIFQVKEREIL